MSNPLQYMVVERHSPNDITKAVNDRIAEGWRPQGGIAYQRVGDTNFYCQALVREGDQRKEKQ